MIDYLNYNLTNLRIGKNFKEKMRNLEIKSFIMEPNIKISMETNLGIIKIFLN